MYEHLFSFSPFPLSCWKLIPSFFVPFYKEFHFHFFHLQYVSEYVSTYIHPSSSPCTDVRDRKHPGKSFRFFQIQSAWFNSAQGYGQSRPTPVYAVYYLSGRCNCPSITMACARGFGNPGIFLGHATLPLQSRPALGRS